MKGDKVVRSFVTCNVILLLLICFFAAALLLLIFFTYDDILQLYFLNNMDHAS